MFNVNDMYNDVLFITKINISIETIFHLFKI